MDIMYLSYFKNANVINILNSEISNRENVPDLHCLNPTSVIVIVDVVWNRENFFSGNGDLA